MTIMQKVLLFIATIGNALSLYAFLFFEDGFSLALLVFTVSYSLIGLYDVTLSRHNLTKLYPVVAYIRYFLESFRTEIQQYFIASNTSELPFNREQRTLVYERAKNARDTIAFGTQQDVMSQNYLSLWHSMAPQQVSEENKRVLIGGKDCTKPYSAAYLNISGMSYGAISSRAIEALNLGAHIGNFFHNTGEGSISPYHEHHQGDLVWQIGSGLFGCRTPDGEFDETKFAQVSQQDHVKMIEIKLSQGAKPGHGGVLPKAKITDEIAKVRGISKDQDCVSPASHPMAQTPLELLTFIKQLRELSNGKPIGFKMCLGNPAEFLAICKAMLKSNIYPDFITVDGAEGGTGAAPVEFSNRLGMTCLDAVYLVHCMLKGCGLRQHIKIIASGKTATGFDLLNKVAAGADLVNAARTMMMALGCIQSQSCNSNHCPTGIATQDPVRGRAINVKEKGQRVANFQRNTVEAFFDLVGSMGLDNPRKLTPNMIKRRSPYGLTMSAGSAVPLLVDNAFLNHDKIPGAWGHWWKMANPDSFYVEDDLLLQPPELAMKAV